MVVPSAMYASETWNTGLTATDWTYISRLHIHLLSQMIRAKPSVPHQIILAEFAVTPIQIEALFHIVTLGTHYVVVALSSSRHLHSEGHLFSWYSQACHVLSTLGIQITDLPAGTHQYIRGLLYRSNLHSTWQGPLVSFTAHTFYLLIQLAAPQYLITC
ncbi:hypothetical protein O6H91_Y166000 [Diphasiastrum complanatum]|nr:hypothetical protein O6H91_Y166000 [Diphasiastrum complanatum]